MAGYQGVKALVQYVPWQVPTVLVVACTYFYSKFISPETKRKVVDEVKVIAKFAIEAMDELVVTYT